MNSGCYRNGGLKHNHRILREGRVRISLFPPEWSASFDHQIVLLKILSVLELSGPLKWKLNFRWRPKLLKREREKKGESNKKKKGAKMTQIE